MRKHYYKGYEVTEEQFNDLIELENEHKEKIRSVLR